MLGPPKSRRLDRLARVGGSVGGVLVTSRRTRPAGSTAAISTIQAARAAGSVTYLRWRPCPACEWAGANGRRWASCAAPPRRVAVRVPVVVLPTMCGRSSYAGQTATMCPSPSQAHDHDVVRLRPVRKLEHYRTPSTGGAAPLDRSGRCGDGPRRGLRQWPRPGARFALRVVASLAAVRAMDGWSVRLDSAWQVVAIGGIAVALALTSPRRCRAITDNQPCASNGGTARGLLRRPPRP